MPGTLDAIAFPALIGDIGGTNARFALIGAADTEVIHLPIVHTASHESIDDAIHAAVIEQTDVRPRSAILALAGPIAGDRVQLTNSHWVVEPRRLIARFGLAEAILLNDFEALSLCLPGLGPADVDPVGGGEAVPLGTCVVVGPGTGLGAGALVRAAGLWIPIPGEGGHIDLAPVDDADMALWPHLERQDGRIAGETLLCGSGLVRLYRGVAARDGVPAAYHDPAEITAAGLAGTDPRAAETLERFAVHLGRLAGNLALIFGAKGGVYLAGGISARIAATLKAGGFREAFVDKYPHRHLLERVPTAIITRDLPALAGIAEFARHPGEFGMELGGRRWTA